MFARQFASISVLFYRLAFRVEAGRGRLEYALQRRGNVLLFLVGIGLLVFGSHELGTAQVIPGEGAPSASGGGPIDQTRLKLAVCKLYQLTEGAFGALVATVAGIGAIIASTVGAFRAGYTLLFTAIGAFILRSLISLFFGSFQCGNTRNGRPSPSVTIP